MGNQDKFTLLIRKSKAFICLLVDDRSHKSTSPNCWCFRNSVLYNATRWLHEVFLIMRLNSVRVPDASTAALLIVLFDPGHLLDISSGCPCGTQDGVCSDKAKVAWHLMAGSHFSGALNGLGAFSSKDLRCSGEYDPLLVKDAKKKKNKFLWYFTARNSTFPLKVHYPIFSHFLSSQTREGGVIVKNIRTGRKKKSPGSQVV